MACLRLTKRAEFLRVAGEQRKYAAPGLVLQAFDRAKLSSGKGTKPSAIDENATRVGFTASRKVGNAVERNRAKRRLRSIAKEILSPHGAPGHDFVMIARKGTLNRPYPKLLHDLEVSLKKLKVWRNKEEEGAVA